MTVLLVMVVDNMPLCSRMLQLSMNVHNYVPQVGLSTEAFILDNIFLMCVYVCYFTVLYKWKKAHGIAHI